MQRIQHAFSSGQPLLNIYFTAGFPQLDDTLRIAHTLEQAGVDMIEIGMPFSDPVADGPTIQASSQAALDNGMTVARLFEQLAALRQQVSIPVILMGYINPVMQFGVERFFQQCAAVGVDGVIIPDLPMQEYLESYQFMAQQYQISNIFLISPNTDVERIRLIDAYSNGFIYMVSSASVTGSTRGISTEQVAYFERIQRMQLQHPSLIGFGISDRESFRQACDYAQGAIIGSAFIKQLQEDASDDVILQFVQRIRPAD